MREKIVRNQENHVNYQKSHWDRLKSLREQSLEITSIFYSLGFDSLTYGSVARGDISENSDIDIVLMQKIPTFRLELGLEQAHMNFYSKRLVQATPNDIIKVHYELNSKTGTEITLTNILTSFTQHAFEFYHFGGALTHQEMIQNLRKSGVDKRLMLIEPTEEGHIESSLSERQYEAAKLLNISQDMIDQRIRVLNRRDKVGRTGLFLNEELDPEQDVEEFLYQLSRTNQFVRRRLNI